MDDGFRDANKTALWQGLITPTRAAKSRLDAVDKSLQYQSTCFHSPCTIGRLIDSIVGTGPLESNTCLYTYVYIVSSLSPYAKYSLQ